MTWILVILMTNGSMKKVKFNTEGACNKVRKEVIVTGLPTMQSAFCVNDTKRKK